MSDDKKPVCLQLRHCDISHLDLGGPKHCPACGCEMKARAKDMYLRGLELAKEAQKSFHINKTLGAVELRAQFYRCQSFFNTAASIEPAVHGCDYMFVRGLLDGLSLKFLCLGPSHWKLK